MQKIIALVFLFLSLVCASVQTFASPAMIGSLAPDFSLPNTSGKTIHLHDFKGKIVVLEWFNPRCPFVKKFYEPKVMQQYQQELTSQGVVWLTISSSAEGKQGFITQESAMGVFTDSGMHSSELLLDHKGVVGRAYGARTTPHMFVIDPRGDLAYAGAIDNKPSTRSSDISKAVNYVLQAVKELQSGKTVSEPHTSAYGCSVKY
jgi:peroxiredoxin